MAGKKKKPQQPQLKQAIPVRAGKPAAVEAPAPSPVVPAPTPAPVPVEPGVATKPVAAHQPAPGVAKVHHAKASAPAPARKQSSQLGGVLQKLPFELPDEDGLPVINFDRLQKKIPWLMPTLYSLIIISFMPLANIYYNRSATHSLPRWSLIPDMDSQPKWKAQQTNLLFADHRASRAWPDGTVGRGMLRDDSHMYEGIVNGQWATGLPKQIEINQALLDRGRERYNIYCSVCHGEAGYGDGSVALRADRLREGTWTVPLTYHGAQVRNRPVGHLFNTITNGIRTMPAYSSQITPEDRWAIIAWIRVLQASQSTDINAVAASEQAELLSRKPELPAPPPPAAPAAAPVPDSSAAAPPGPETVPAPDTPTGAAPPPASQEGGQ